MEKGIKIVNSAQELTPFNRLAPKMGVLLVEDHEELRELGREYLLSIGLDVMVARNGKEALQLAVCRKYDLILMDLQMPVLGGFEALPKLRASQGKTPIIAMTGRSSYEERIECLKAGFNDVLTKPYLLNELTSIIEKYRPHED